MSTTTISMDVTLSRVDCGSCGGVYAITERHHDWCRENSKSWTCPYCGVGWGFNHDGSPLKKAQRALEEEKRRAAAAEGRARREQERAECALRSAAAYKGQVTKVKKRVANGVCPCCNRHFENLHRHMQDQHPDWAPDELVVRHRGGPWFNVVRKSDGAVIDYAKGRAAAMERRDELAQEAP